MTEQLLETRPQQPQFSKISCKLPFKMAFLIPAICILGFGCSRDSDNNNGTYSQDNSSDWSITTRVKTEILSDTSISASARFVSVNTTNGVVTLTGTVPTREDGEKIVKIVKKVHGVVKVDNQMTISNN